MRKYVLNESKAELPPLWVNVSASALLRQTTTHAGCGDSSGFALRLTVTTVSRDDAAARVVGEHARGGPPGKSHRNIYCY